MRYGAILMGVFLSSTTWADQPKEAEGVIEPQADAQLHKMSNYLDGLKSFRVAATTIDEKVTTDGQKIQELKESTMAAKRPNAFRVDRRGPAGHAVFRYDGKQFSIDAVDKKIYAMAPAPATIEAAVDAAREQLKIDAPAGDLIVRDSYHALLDGVRTGRYVGLEPVADGMAHHLAMTKKDVDFQIWIADGARPVPVRYVITSKDMPGHPEFTVEMRNWEPNVPVPEESVAFTPAPGAQQVVFAPQGKGKNQ